MPWKTIAETREQRIKAELTGRTERLESHDAGIARLMAERETMAAVCSDLQMELFDLAAAETLVVDCIA